MSVVLYLWLVALFKAAYDDLFDVVQFRRWFEILNAYIVVGVGLLWSMQYG